MRSPYSLAPMRAVLGKLLFGVVVAACASMFACTSAEPPAEPLATRQAALVPLEPPTTVTSGTPSGRTRKCPGGTLPDQCGTWAGVELEVSREATGSDIGDYQDQHCLCDSIDFQIPARLPVSRGKAGWDWDKVNLSFRTTTGGTVQCRYRGNGPPGTAGGGDAYVFERCSDGSRPGQAKRSDWFELELDHSQLLVGPVEVELRLGEADVVDGVVQEQIFYASDPRLPEAALHVPRGAAPAFETFSLEVLSQIPLGTLIPNADDPATTVSFAVDVHAESSEAFAFTPVQGASCPRIELPYDPATLELVAGPGAESTIQAHQLTTLVGVTSGAAVLASAGPITVDLARRTFSFCVEHLSFYVGTSGSFDSLLTIASIQSTGGGALPATDLLSAGALPSLTPLQTYQLTLGFQRVGGTSSWLSGGNLYLVAVGPPTGGSPPVVALTAPTPWGTPVSTNTFSPFTIPIGGTAVFTLDLTCPTTPTTMNFCLRNGTGTTSFFGECFSWDLVGAASAGTDPAVLVEICDNIDNDGDGLTDEGVTEPCYTGPSGTQNQGICHGGTRTCTAGSWGPCVGQVLPGTEMCGNSVDEDCDGSSEPQEIWFLDGDNDGFGDPEISRCAPGANWVTNADDCCDSDPDAHPGQTDLFGEPVDCVGGGFDYDCDGEITRFNAEVGAETTPFGCTFFCNSCVHDGWVGAVAACGVTTDFEHCGLGPEPCIGSCLLFPNVTTIQQEQTCR